MALLERLKKKNAGDTNRLFLGSEYMKDGTLANRDSVTDTIYLGRAKLACWICRNCETINQSQSECCCVCKMQKNRSV